MAIPIKCQPTIWPAVVRNQNGLTQPMQVSAAAQWMLGAHGAMRSSSGRAPHSLSTAVKNAGSNMFSFDTLSADHGLAPISGVVARGHTHNHLGDLLRPQPRYYRTGGEGASAFHSRASFVPAAF